MLEPRYGLLFLATGEEEDFLETMSNQGTSKEDDVPMPGFRFHPTDEELVAFYLRRKVEKKPISIELIKQIDIYKYDPWDLPKASCSTGQDLEWYFFCKRGRKYRNSIRPNRVTGSGFWKATGIDKPVYSGRGERGHERIGLKKTLVYYSGSAGKGTKTDWMMHEFRLPANEPDTDSDLANAKSTAPEAEIWTLCRIFKRNVSHRKYTPDWRELSAKKHPTSSSSQVLSMDCDNREDYISFDTPFLYRNEKPEEIKPVVNLIDERNQLHAGQSSSMASLPLSSSLTISPVPDANELFAYENWDDELRSFVEFALDPSRM